MVRFIWIWRCRRCWIVLGRFYTDPYLLNNTKPLHVFANGWVLSGLPCTVVQMYFRRLVTRPPRRRNVVPWCDILGWGPIIQVPWPRGKSWRSMQVTWTITRKWMIHRAIHAYRKLVSILISTNIIIWELNCGSLTIVVSPHYVKSCIRAFI